MTTRERMREKIAADPDIESSTAAGRSLIEDICDDCNTLKTHAPKELHAMIDGIYWRAQNSLGSFASSATALSDTARLDWLQSQLAKGWGDGFAMHSLDGGALYPRPWKKELESMRGMEPDLKTGAFLWQADIRTAIDEAIRRADGKANNG